jgi:hypothetical protein
MRPRRSWHTAVVLAIAATIVTAFLLGVAAAAGRNAPRGCTYGLSSIGPVEINNSQIVGGDSVPRTEACLR